MSHIEPNSPSLRLPRPAYVRKTLPTCGKEYLPLPSATCGKDFLGVLHRRASKREFGPLTDHELASVLWHSSKVKSIRVDEDGHEWQQRPVPSAGGLHPIETLVFCRDGVSDAVFVYEPMSHSLGRLCIRSTQAVAQFLEHLDGVLPIRGATVLWHLADFNLTLAKYCDGESLVYRDAGALDATVNLVAEALRLSCCIIGVTGEPYLSRVARWPEGCVGVGGCYVGHHE